MYKHKPYDSSSPSTPEDPKGLFHGKARHIRVGEELEAASRPISQTELQVIGEVNERQERNDVRDLKRAKELCDEAGLASSGANTGGGVPEAVGVELELPGLPTPATLQAVGEGFNHWTGIRPWNQGRSDGRTLGRAYALRVLDDLLRDTENLTQLRTSLQEAFSSNPAYFFLKFVIPLIPASLRESSEVGGALFVGSQREHTLVVVTPDGKTLKLSDRLNERQLADLTDEQLRIIMEGSTDGNGHAK